MMSVSSLNARFDSPALGEGTTVTGSAVIDESKASFDVSASGYLAEDGSFDFARATPVGTATMQGMSTATLARLVPQHAELIELAVDKPLDVTVVTAIEAGEPRAAITATSAEHEIALTVVRGAETLRVMDGRGNVTVTPALAAALQEGAEQPIALAEPARVRFDLEPFDLPAGGEFPATELKGRLEADRVDLEQVPGVAERVGVDAVVADVSVARAMSSVTLKGSAALRRAVADQPLAGARYELDLVNDGGTYAVRQVVLDLSDVVVRRAEHVLGRERGALWNWLGSRGNAHVSMDTVGDGFTAAIRADFENLRGEFTAVARGDMLTVSDGTANLTLSREAIQERVGRPAGSAPPGSPARPASPGGVTVVADVPVVLQVRALRLPRSILSGKPVDPAAASIDLGLTGGPLLLDATQGRSTIDDLDISLRGDDLDTGLELSISGDVSAAGGGKPGALSISGQVTNLVADDGTFAPRQAELRMTAEARGLPTAVVDAVLGWEGLLTSAIGSPIDLDATAKRFSRTTGDLEVRFETPTGWLEAFALGRDDALRILGKSPLSAELELTPPLCRQVLYKIHPLLADIRTTKHPMRASMRGAVMT
jgi:hypothetical protein